MIKIAIAEDHSLFRETFASFCRQAGFDVVIIAKDGIDLKNKLHNSILPNVIFMDICMPNMDGKESTLYVRKNFPQIEVIALSLHIHEKHLIEMINAGAKAYLSKQFQNKYEITIAVDCVMNGGIYFHQDLLKACNLTEEYLNINNKKYRKALLTGKEYEFINHCASDDSYQQIADKMQIAYRTIDCYRDSIFKKLNIKSRAGLALYAVENGLNL